MSLAVSPRTRRRGAFTIALAGLGLGLLTIGACTDGRGTPPAGTTPNATGDSAADAPAAKEQFDPIKENGPIFKDWTKPELTLVFTGNQHGYFEPCGCADPAGKKGA